LPGPKLSAVPTPLLLPTAQFAVWAREHGVRLPYPLDVSGVPGAGQRRPDPTAPQLTRLAQIASDPRVGVFRLRVDPSTGTSDSAVAVADDEVGVLVSTSAGQVEIRPVEATELVISLGASLPALAPLTIDVTTLPEPRWNAILAALTRPDAAAVLEESELPLRLTQAMLTPPRSIGTLGALTWAGGSSRLGALLASWFEYRSGTLLARLDDARLVGGDRSVVLEPYSLAAAAGALTSIATAALRASR
jgi:hypothetical protein